jgi:la-related protein 1
MEEECGDMETAAKILKKGLVFCEYSENLLARAIKHEERKKNLDGARELLSRLRHVGIDKVWRTVLEGALLEARAGNNQVARKIFKYLMSHVPWYGPIYNEAFRLEEKSEHHAAALNIVERGLKEIPRYGPLWFGAFRLCERLDMEAGQDTLARGHVPDLPRTRDAISRALGSISKELIWKVHFEAAQIEERVASMTAVVRVMKRSGGTTSSALGLSVPKDAVAKARDELLER